MKQMRIISLFLLCLWVGFLSCSTEDETLVQPPTGQTGDAGQSGEDNNNSNNDTAMNKKITVKIEGVSFAVTLQDNATVKAFRSMLPLTLTMNEHGGNEKYYNLAGNLPTNAYRPEMIRRGDLMLWGDNCLVLFYETFSSSYSYTPIGKIDNPSGLPEAVGKGRVIMTFE